jgi:hypothetical protein
LDWEKLRNPKMYKGWKPPAGHRIKVALLLPADSKAGCPEALAAIAEAIGIPSVSIISEPEAILVFHVQKYPQEVGKTIVVAGVGSASADGVGSEVLSSTLLRMKQIG